jgi:hypothetical protein
VHYERIVGNVPEPYRSMYKFGQRTVTGELVFTPPPAPAMLAESAALAPHATRRGEDRAAWQARTAYWYQELYASLRQSIHTVMQPYPLAIASLWYEVPTARMMVVSPRTMHDARARTVHARAMLLEVLPQLARQEGVPPGWLQPF